MRAAAASKPSRPASAAPARPRRSSAPPSPPTSSVASSAALPVGAGVGQALLLEAQRLLLPGILQLGHGDLLHLVAEDVGFAGPLLVVAAERGQRVVQRPQLAAQTRAPG